MEYVYAALMLHKLKKEITEENVTSIVKASGAELNEAKVKSLVASLADEIGRAHRLNSSHT